MRLGAIFLSKLGWTFMALWLAVRVTGNASNWLPFVVALVTTAITYPLLDLPFLVRPGFSSPWNFAISASEGILAATLIWGLAPVLPNTGPVNAQTIVLAGLGVTFGEWFIHRALIGPKPVAERQNRPPGLGDD